MEAERTDDLYSEYEPLKWPPDKKLAELHMKCSCPGKDNIEGAECPCCGRYEKMRIRKWITRDIVKDFKSYGGGISAYFEMMKYCGLSLVILAICVVGFHIYCLETACNELPTLPGKKECPTFLRIFRFLPSESIYKVLYKTKHTAIAEAFFWLQLGAFLYLILVTIGMKWFLQYINAKKVIKEDKIYAQYSLMIKNIPLFYQIEDVRKEILEIAPQAEICELFFVHEIAELEIKSKRLLDLHFEIEFTKSNIADEIGGSIEELQALKEKYIHTFEEVEGERRKLNMNNGRAIIVFNKIEDREKIHHELSISEFDKFMYHSKKLLGQNTRKLHFYTDKIAEPQEILWNYIGEASVSKTKVRIETTVLGLGFIILCFIVLYFPILYSDEAKIHDRGGIGAWLSMIIALIIQILSIVYRMIILRLIPARQPSSRESESYFIVITTVMFHFFFYLVAPACYYLFADDIPAAAKLVQLFVTVMMFLMFSIIIALIDVRYRLFNSRRNKTLKSRAFWGKLCQIRLHQEIRYPSFPIEFKLMILLKIWAFNAFYIFQIPYVLLMFVVVIFIIYWIDKKNIYTHYKMQAYLSIDLEQSVLRDYIFMFLLCVSCGYAISAVDTWQYIFIGIIFLFSIIVNVMLTFQAKQSTKTLSAASRALTLNEVLKNQSVNPKQSMLHTIREAEFKEHLFILDNDASTVSLGSTIYLFGYKEIYESYLMQFKNRHFHRKLQETYTLLLQNKNMENLATIVENATQKRAESKRKLSKESQMEDFQSRNDSKPELLNRTTFNPNWKSSQNEKARSRPKSEEKEDIRASNSDERNSGDEDSKKNPPESEQ